MIEIKINERIKEVTPNLKLGVVQAAVTVTQHDKNLWREIDACIQKILSGHKLETIPRIPQITALRDAYKAMGKDPGRYRGSSEALVRRILQGKGLYKVNTIVDINNLVSLETLHSVGSYDLSKIKSPVVFRIGEQGESYKGIGKDIINIAELPVFADGSGPFGSPTSDSERAMITTATKEIAMIIISFNDDSNLKNSLRRASQLLQRYAAAANIQTVIIE